MPDGVVLLDGENTILWANRRLREWCGGEQLAGHGFYAALGSPEILGPDYCPFHTALASKQAGHLHAPHQRRQLLPGPRRAGSRDRSAAGSRRRRAFDRDRPRRHQ